MRAWVVVVVLVVLSVAGCTTPLGASVQSSGSPPDATSASAAPASTTSSVRKITAGEFARMKYVSWRSDCLQPSGLRFVDVPYHDSNGDTQRGTLVVRAGLATEVGQIFEEIFNTTDYRIQQIKPIEDIAPAETRITDSGQPARDLDEKSMEANNTSAFNCRELDGKLDQHGKANAIDINPLKNPMVEDCVSGGVIHLDQGCKVSPPQGRPYIQPGADDPAILTASSPVVKIFKDHGLRWGGDWITLKDPQHFDAQGK